MGTAQSRRAQKTMGEGIAETGSDRRTEVSDSCGGLPHTRTFGILVKFFSLNSEGRSKPRRVGKFSSSESEPCPIVYRCDAALH
jgi:hypothetical protein